MNCRKPVTRCYQAGVCPDCKRSGVLSEIVTPERHKAETEALKDLQRAKDFSPGFQSDNLASQMGQPLQAKQVLEVLKRFVPGVTMRRSYNAALKRWLMALYVPFNHASDMALSLVSPYERKNKIKFVCCMECEVMPEWDVIPRTDDGMPMPPVRGWRSILGIFHRVGLIPFIPDDGRRLSYYQIKESPLKGRI